MSKFSKIFACLQEIEWAEENESNHCNSMIVYTEGFVVLLHTTEKREKLFLGEAQFYFDELPKELQDELNRVEYLFLWDED